MFCNLNTSCSSWDASGYAKRPRRSNYSAKAAKLSSLCLTRCLNFARDNSVRWADPNLLPRAATRRSGDIFPNTFKAGPFRLVARYAAICVVSQPFSCAVISNWAMYDSQSDSPLYATCLCTGLEFPVISLLPIGVA